MASTASEANYLASSSGYTDIGITRFTYQWTVKNLKFRHYNLKEERIYSPTFTIEHEGKKMDWMLLAGINEPKDHLGLFLRLKNGAQADVLALFALSIINADGNKDLEMSLSEANNFRTTNALGFPKMMKIADLFDPKQRLMSGADLIVFCEIRILGKSRERSMKRKITVPKWQLLEDYRKLLCSSESSDVSLMCQGTEFRCIKAILTSRSEVFAAMFRHDTAEAQIGHAVIDDISPGTMSQLLEFIYTGWVKDIVDNPTELLFAADKYGMDRLKCLCERTLANSLNAANVCHILDVADLYSAPQLRDHAMEFIREKGPSNVVSWKRLKEESPGLALEVLDPE